MRVKMNTSVGGSINASFGDVVEMSDDEGRRFCDRGLATEVTDETPETPEAPEAVKAPRARKTRS